MNKLIGITGYIGAGKTTLALKLVKENKDYIYINVDEFRYELYKDNSFKEELEVDISELKKYEYLDSNIINRYIYEDEEYMQHFKDILYKRLFAYIDTFKDKTIIVDWALIIKDNLAKKFEKIFFLDVPIDIRISRFTDEDLSREEIMKRDELQRVDNIPDNVITINNSTSIEEVISIIDSLPCKFTLPDDGGKTIWEITHKCNYHCSYCIFSCNGTNIKDELTTEECFHVIDELRDKGFKHLKITGGEPFIRKDMTDILKYASKYMITDISTNASFITDELVDRLNKIDLKMIHVSIDGDKLTHETLRGKNTYDLTIRGLESLKKSKNKVRIGTVISSLNEESLESIIKDMLEYKVDEIIFSIMEPPKDSSREYFKTRTINSLISEINSLKDKYRDKLTINANFITSHNHTMMCPAGDKFLYINNFGCVSPCPWVHEKNPSMISKISLRNHTLDEVMDDETMKEFLRIKKSGKCYGEI